MPILGIERTTFSSSNLYDLFSSVLQRFGVTPFNMLRAKMSLLSLPSQIFIKSRLSQNLVTQ